MTEQKLQISNINYQLSEKYMLFIVGPTASGKSRLAMDLALKFNGEIVCADSQTLRKDLNIGTAKPSEQDRKEVAHHLLDIIQPYERFSVNEFKQLALQVISGIQSRGKLPIIVGGSGLYIDALFFNFELEELLENTTYKQELEELSIGELQQIVTDSNFPMPNNKNNPRHLIGVILRKGKVRQNKEPFKGAQIYGILPDDEILKKRINDRVEEMFNNGFVNEVERVIGKYGQPPKALDAIGYPIGSEYLEGDLTLEEAKEKFKTAHWQYARRQKSWFKRNPYIIWSNTGIEAMNTIVKDVEASMNKSVTIE
jgi:tRNA dimethylallyltransferase